MRLFDALLRGLIRKGRLTVVDAGGRSYVYGDPATSTRPVTIRFTDRWTPRRAALNPALALGEAYMDGRMIVGQGDIRDFLDLIGLNIHWGWDDSVGLGLWQPWRYNAWWTSWNWRRRARRNVAHHYDLSGELFALFLDPDLQYSCAYFVEPDATLEQAQAAKQAHIAAKLDLRPGQRVLDIGCGWGGL